MPEVHPPADWPELLTAFPGASFLQTNAWADVKSAVGWHASRFTWQGKGAQAASLVLERAPHMAGISLPFRILYLPRGPLADWSDPHTAERALEWVETCARSRKAVFVRIDPFVAQQTDLPGNLVPLNPHLGSLFQSRGWVVSDDQIQYANTMVLDLRQGEERLLANMKPKTRYNLRLAERKGVTIRRGDAKDYALLYRMYLETSVRDGFLIRPEAYYRQVWERFQREDQCLPLIAECGGEALAGLVIFFAGSGAWYVHGMSRAVQREKMPNFLLQWEAIREAIRRGKTYYDLWGAPDELREDDPMYGVYRFKEGLGAELVRTWGAWDFITDKRKYFVYTKAIPRILALLRRRSMSRNQAKVLT